MRLSSTSSRQFFFPSISILYQNCFRPSPERRLPGRMTKHNREICWFLSRIPFYLEKDCTLSQAVDFAIDDCLTEGILYSLFFRRREEIKKMLLENFIG